MLRISQTALLWLAFTVPSAADTVAIFPPKLLDTSHEARDQAADHARRLAFLAGELSDELPSAVEISRDRMDAACSPQTTDCLLALAIEEDADKALLIVVQKTSTLIIQIFATLVDTDSGELIASPSLNFRGDTDESWRRAARFLARDLNAR